MGPRLCSLLEQLEIAGTGCEFSSIALWKSPVKAEELFGEWNALIITQVPPVVLGNTTSQSVGSSSFYGFDHCSFSRIVMWYIVKATLEEDESQNYQLLSVMENETSTTMLFKRHLRTCDPNDLAITVRKGTAQATSRTNRLSCLTVFPNPGSDLRITDFSHNSTITGIYRKIWDHAATFIRPISRALYWCIWCFFTMFSIKE